MEAGKLRHRVTIQIAGNPTQDANGQETIPYTSGGDAWASIEGLTGRQLALAQASTVTSLATHLVTMRWRKLRPMVDRIMFVQSNDPPRYFEITSAIDPDGRRIELRLMVKEKVG